MPDSIENARHISVQALTFVAGDEAVLSQFLETTGWTPESLKSAGARAGVLLAALDYLMGEEDLLLTFAVNAGLDPADVARAHYALHGAVASNDARN